MARIYIFQPFIEQHLHGNVQAVNQPSRGRVGIGAIAISRDHIAKMQEPTRKFGAFHSGQCFWANPDDCKAGWQHKALLAAGHRDIDAPAIHIKRHRTNR